MISEVWHRVSEIASYPNTFLSYFFDTMASRLIASNAGPITGDLLEDSKYFKQFEALKSENSQKSSVQKITVSQKVWIQTFLDQRSWVEDGRPENFSVRRRRTKVFYESVRLKDEFGRWMVKISKKWTEADAGRRRTKSITRALFLTFRISKKIISDQWISRHASPTW